MSNNKEYTITTVWTYQPKNVNKKGEKKYSILNGNFDFVHGVAKTQLEQYNASMHAKVSTTIYAPESPIVCYERDDKGNYEIYVWDCELRDWIKR